ncbi:MAG: glycosyltransferase family 4 protein [Pseudomonadota bacterium]
MPKRRQPSADFIFWGRLHKQKDIPRALKLFSGVCKSCPDSRLLIIGPDGGELNEVIAVTERLKIKNNLCLRSGMKREDIFAEAQRASFFLQTSKEEGMSMAVVEAMQLGLVPVVTNVGEISNYCRHGDNSIIVQKEQDTDSIDSILRLLNDPAKFSQMSYAAAEEWQSKATYREDVLSACQDIVERGAS